MMKRLGIAEFKAKCIDALKTVQRTGDPLIVTLRKQPIATITPYRETPRKRTLGALRGRMEIHGDIVHSNSGDEREMET
jgi:antitoxin (DNA-binding transcriptional repressor) of toxin-antitoxin stability system